MSAPLDPGPLAAPGPPPESPPPVSTPPVSPPAPSDDDGHAPRTRHRSATLLLWWALGGVLLLAGQHGNPSVAVAAWLFPVFLLRFTRRARIGWALLGLTLAHAVAGAVWILGIQLPVDGPPVDAMVGCALLNLLLIVPFLVDRALAVPLRARHPVLATLVFPSARVAVELVVVLISPFGIVFGMLASSQHEVLPLLQIMSVTGLYGVSFLVAWLAPVADEAWRRPRRRLAPAIAFGAVLVTVLAYGGVVLSTAPVDAPTVRVAGVTPSKSLADAADALPDAESAARGNPAVVRRAMDPVLDDLTSSTGREAAAGAKFVLWSEAAAWVVEEDLPSLYKRVGKIAERQRVHVLVAVAVLTDAAPHGRNIISMIGPEGNLLWEYDKSRPVPGMEQIDPGTDDVPSISTQYGTIAGLICFDLDFPEAAVNADTVLVPASDWRGFDRLHTEKARLRAIEYGYSVVRQDAHGLAATFDPQGRQLASSNWFSTGQQTMVAEVPTEGRRSVYARVGDAFGWACVGLLCVLTLLGTSRRLTRRREDGARRPATANSPRLRL
ncbi:nitrilase-related carbon-nitrogen hydrolase [Streptomyces sp. NPDC048172]|uniref:nitrilase-related carbon-nitrogen hydrolase n=1 Tax=Streptomyces sp. NPDC048172 TaxID=3365505 RepID=UPI00372344EE